MKYLPVIITLVSVTYGQLAIKYGVNKLGPIPTANAGEILRYFLHAITDLMILSGLLAAVVAAFSWIAAMSRFELSSVYPLLSLNFVLVPALSIFLFGEAVNAMKLAGIVVIVLGVVVLSRGLG